MRVQGLSFIQLKAYTIKKGIKNSKCKIISEKKAFKVYRVCFGALKKYSTKYKKCKLAYEEITSQRIDKTKLNALQKMCSKYQTAMKMKDQNLLADNMHDSRFITVYFKTWIKKYNISQKKKYLNEVCDKYQTANIRNKMFTDWMHIASQSMKLKIEECQID